MNYNNLKILAGFFNNTQPALSHVRAFHIDLAEFMLPVAPWHRDSCVALSDAHLSVRSNDLTETGVFPPKSLFFAKSLKINIFY